MHSSPLEFSDMQKVCTDIYYTGYHSFDVSTEQICLVRIPFDFVDPELVYLYEMNMDSIQSTIQRRLEEVVTQPGVAYIMESLLSVALLPEKITRSSQCMSIYSNITLYICCSLLDK